MPTCFACACVSFLLRICLQWFTRQVPVATLMVVLSNHDVLTWYGRRGTLFVSTDRFRLVASLYFYCLMLWWLWMHMMLYFFVCRRCCYYLEPVGHSLFMFWRRLCCVGMSWFVRHCCLMYRRRWWGCQSWPLFSPCVTFGSYLFSEEAPLRPSRLLSITIRCPTV